MKTKPKRCRWCGSTAQSCTCHALRMAAHAAQLRRAITRLKRAQGDAPNGYR